MTVYKVAYMGYSEKMIQYIINHVQIELCRVVGVKNRISETQYELIDQLNIPYLELSDSSEIEKVSKFVDDMDFIIMYKFEFILSQSFVNQFNVINFHGGNLRTNRGAHAVVWSILKCEKETCLSAYKITGKIDLGILLGEYYIAIDKEETTKSLNDKMLLGIPVLLDKVVEYFEGVNIGVAIDKGEYRRKIKEDDYTLDLNKDSYNVIDAKIRSQVGYTGAICVVDGKKYRVCNRQKEVNNVDKEIEWKYDKGVLRIYLKEIGAGEQL